MKRFLRHILAVLASVLALVGPACTDLDLESQAFRCETDDDCLYGRVCLEGGCRAPGWRPDGFVAEDVRDVLAPDVADVADLADVADAADVADVLSAPDSDAGTPPQDVSLPDAAPDLADVVPAVDAGEDLVAPPDVPVDVPPDAPDVPPDVPCPATPCAAADEVRCDGDRVVLCARDASGCLVAGPPTPCDDGDACTDDTCVAVTGCVHADRSEGATCDDGEPCTADDRCRGAADARVCRGLPVEGTAGISCGGACCPALAGYVGACNGRDACEYGPETVDPPWRRWNVWIWVPPGTFVMGGPEDETDSPETYAAERPLHAVTITDGFFVGRFEVSVAQYAACEAAGACETPVLTEPGADPEALNRPPEEADHPQNGLTWADAQAVCAWLVPGGRLPSEAEWEYAASGAIHRVYPWGDAPAPSCDGDTAVFNAGGGPSAWGCGTGGTAPCGSRPGGASAFGAVDMAGNVAEWVEDCWHADYGDGEAVVPPRDGSAWVADCPAFGASRVQRGSAFRHVAVQLRSAWRTGVLETLGASSAGVRCVFR